MIMVSNLGRWTFDQVVQDFLQSQNLGDQAYNTRLFKEGGGYKLAIASAQVNLFFLFLFNLQPRVERYKGL